ncbi:(deoxy)nucleoside triphosphate pyrophosphohydrolase [Bacillaceae bacterium SIJ1]|uniref:(deoxy)nucleoside triphosphate pyrophosphohydrolase n=1 Tax=Litoribacterium kuwaitense TaxID=1398745 RepID=UPI0013EA0E20|nr:(deoxy)nucleoside triphosphate pyrophosphohydrolase [Litoribacterium kuwaitense]NGP45698.1 (deoxy)nucleoside triphosphate pyrophosphohydrolase [Litoribacterium kuwaitense]
MKEMHVVGAVIVREEDDAVLCAQRSEKMSMPLLWEFPGGKVEAGETFETALTREIQEELGCYIAVGEKIAMSTIEKEASRITLHTFACRLVSGQPQAYEHKEVRWVKRQELNKLEWPELDLETVGWLIKRKSRS